MKKFILKNGTELKELLFQVALVIGVGLAVVVFQGCKDNAERENNEMNHNDYNKGDVKEVAEEHNDAKFSKDDEKAAQFLVDAADLNMTEIKLGRLAQERGSSKSVKDLGKMMEGDHNKTLEELKTLASSKNITIPEALSEKGNKEYDKLDGKAGRDFDKEYADMMVDGHKDAIKKFEKIAEDSEDTEIKNWANQTLPALRKHLDHSITTRDKLKDKDKKEKM
jgi:putative membrane protein